MRQFWYIVTTTPDRGPRFRLRVLARNKEQAIQQVMTCEGCPRCAIVKIVRAA